MFHSAFWLITDLLHKARHVPRLYLLGGLLCVTLPASAQTTALTLTDLQQLLQREHPQLEQLRQLEKAAQAQVPQVTAWNNPQIGIQQLNVPTSPLRIGAAQQTAYTLTQSFSFPGKKQLAGEIAQTQAQIIGTQTDSTRLQLLAQLKGYFYQFLLLEEQQRLNSDHIQRLEQIKQISKIRYANNAAAYVDYLNAQVAQSSAQNDQLALVRQLENTRQTLNTLIGRAPQTPLYLQGQLPGDTGQALSLPQLHDLALQLHPQLKGSTLQNVAAEKSLALAKMAYLPDFQTVLTRASDDAPLGWRSNNHYAFEVDLILPSWFLEKEKPGIDQAQANLLASRANDQDVRQQVLLAVTNSWQSLEQTRQQVALLRDRQLPEARTAWRLAIQNYANNAQDFANLLLSQTNLRNTELAYVQAQADSAIALATLEASVGRDHLLSN